ncbi:MAG: hypothetical protein JWM28_3184 [Chitinophagaceae bacterium]|nr:hypothetical protein [Chitinophagaceae bacterium]
MKTATLIILLIIPTLSFSQGDSEIVLLDMQVKGRTVTLSNPVNVTNHKGYDNQPFFSPKEPLLYFTSDRDTPNTDIKIYNYQTGTTSFLTNTPENEYSPTVTPDGKFISCIIARKSPFAQDLGKYPVNGGDPIILINNLVVGYHAWIDDNRLLLFVLDGNRHNSLHYYDLRTKEDKVIAKSPGRSLWKIPGGNAMSFVDETDSLSWKIKKLDINTMQISDIGPTLLRKEDMAWTSNGIIIMSDGSSLFSLQPGGSEGWQKINILNNNASIQGITRLAVNADNSKIAIVVRE